jgi:hypothetical protein
MGGELKIIRFSNYQIERGQLRTERMKKAAFQRPEIRGLMRADAGRARSAPVRSSKFQVEEGEEVGCARVQGSGSGVQSLRFKKSKVWKRLIGRELHRAFWEVLKNGV